MASCTRPACHASACPPLQHNLERQLASAEAKRHATRPCKSCLQGGSPSRGWDGLWGGGSLVSQPVTWLSLSSTGKPIFLQGTRDFLLT